MYRFQLILVQAILIIVIVLVSAHVLQLNNLFLLAIFLAWPLLLLLLNRPDILMVATICTYAGLLRAPGIGGQIKLYQLFVITLCAVNIIRMTITKEPLKAGNASRKWAIFFGLVLVVTMAFRGTGFRMLGDSKWGGMRYVDIIVAMSFFLVARNFPLGVRQCKISLVVMCLLAFIPFLAEICYVLTHGVIFQQFYIFQPSGWDALQSFEKEELTRFTTGALISEYLTMLPFLLFPFRKAYRLLYIVLIVAAQLLGALSGHRLTIIMNILFIVFYSFITTKGRRLPYFITLTVMTALLFALALIFARHLPLSFQRTISWVPFIEIAPEAAMSASGTIVWRSLIWKEALREIPKYWLLGKGYAYDFSELYSALRSGHYDLDWPIIQAAYHNGPLSLLIGMGTVGFVAGVGLLVTLFWRHFRLINAAWKDNDLHRIHLVLSVRLMVYILIFLLLYGDVFVSFPTIFMLAGLLEIVRASERTAVDKLDPVQKRYKPFMPQADPLERKTHHK